MPQYISLEANVHFDELVFCDNSLHINTINKPVAECTDIVQNFLDNFGFLDDLALFDKKKYAQLFEYDDDTVLTQQRRQPPCLFQTKTHLLGTYQPIPILTSLKMNASS